MATDWQLEYMPCAICESEESYFLFWARDWLYGNQGRFSVVQCVRCGLVYINPRIAPNQIASCYSDDYYAYDASIRPNNSSGAKLKGHIQSLVAEEIYGYPPGTAKLPNWVPSYLIARILKGKGWYLSRMLPWREGGRLLDIGCGNGTTYLTRMRTMGWDTYGVELNDRACQYAIAAGHNVFCGQLSDAAWPNDYFDAISLWDTLEHIHNPTQVLTECHQILKTDGILALSVPNFGSIYARMFKDKWFMFTAPLHCHHYTFDTLKKLLDKCRFRVSMVEYPLGESGIAESLRNYMRFKGHSPSFMRSRPLNILLKLLDRLAPYGHIIVWATKPNRQQ